MKKTLKTLICSVLLIVMIISVAACGGNNELQEKLDDLQTRLEQQEEKLKKQEEKIKDLENKNKELKEKNQELWDEVNEIPWAIPHEAGVVGYDDSLSFLNAFHKSAELLRSKSELNTYLSALNEQYQSEKKDHDPEKWSMQYGNGYGDGRFDEDMISDRYGDAYFESNALIFCIFTSKNIFTYLYGNGDILRNRNVFNFHTIQIKIDYMGSEETVPNYVMVLLEVDKNDVIGINDIHLELGRVFCENN